MEALGKIGNFYVVLLFGILLAGIGVLSVNFSRKIWSSTEGLLDKKGGKLMNKWLKLALVAFTGLLVASFALGLTNSMGAGTGDSMANMSGMAGSSADGSGGASSHNHTTQQSGGQQSGNGAPAANWAGYAQGMNNPGVNMEAQMYMLQNQIQQLQQQLYYVIQMQNQLRYYNGPMGMPGNMNQIPSQGMNNMNNMNNMNSSSMGSQSSSGGNSGGGMGGMGMM